MTSKWTNISKRMLFAYFMLSGLIFLFTPARVTNRLQLAYAGLFSGPLSTGRTLALASRTPAASEAGASADTVRRLKNDVANLRAQLRAANTTIYQLARVRTVRAWDRMAFPTAAVTVVNPAQTEMIIKLGDEEGVAVGHYVMALSDHSLIGRVSALSPHTAKVKLISDPTSQVPVEIGLSGIQGVLQGRGDGTAKIPLISTRQAVAAGDPVYARRQMDLDVPMVIGQVAECRKDPDHPLLWDITVRATCDIATLEDVAVVVPAQ
ncbi:MAG: rod shape-determining protein MreC [Sedimentisphaerales bacterium]|nr:rod shape-determining protein MreC [Sedimentisphaerales bacterium]